MKMFKEVQVFIPLAIFYLHGSLWSWTCSCLSMTISTEGGTFGAKNISTLQLDLSPDEIPTSASVTQTSKRRSMETKVTRAKSTATKPRVSTEELSHTTRHHTTTERSKTTESEPTIRSSSNTTGTILGISREAANIITGVVVIYIALVVTVVALRLCSSRILKKQETLEKRKLPSPEKLKAKEEHQLQLEEVKVYDGTKQTDELQEDGQNVKNAPTDTSEIESAPVLILNNSEVRHKDKKSTANRSSDDEDTNMDSNHSKDNEIDAPSVRPSQNGNGSSPTEYLKKKHLEENKEHTKLEYKSTNENEDKQPSDCSVSNEMGQSAATLGDIGIFENGNLNDTVDASVADDTFPPPPLPTSGRVTQATMESVSTPPDQVVFTVLTTAMLTDNPDAMERELAVESTDL